MDEADFEYLTAEDLEKLGRMADAIEGGGRPDLAVDAMPNPPELDDEPVEIADDDPTRITKFVSQRIVDYSDQHTIVDTAEEFDVSERTVERHRAYWNDSDDKDAVTFESRPPVDANLCRLFRKRALQGWTIKRMAHWYNVANATVHNHVAVGAYQPCSHDVELGRISFSHGGSRGNPNRPRNDQGQFVDD